MGNGAQQIVMSEDLRQAVDGVKSMARSYAARADMWRAIRKPLAGAHPPDNPALKAINVVAGHFGHAVGFLGDKGRALRANAHLAGDVQRMITTLTLHVDPLTEPKRSINLSYLQHLADATIVAAAACQDLCCGNSPSDKRRTQLAAAWVVALACSAADRHPSRPQEGATLLDRSVKQAAIKAYPLFSAGRDLNTTLDPGEALFIAYCALDVV